MRYAELLLKQYDLLGHDARGALRKGSSRPKLRSAFKRFLKRPHPVNNCGFPSKLPDALLDLYCWHDGGNAELIPYFQFTTFASALDSWDLTSEMAEDSVVYENGNVVYSDTSAFPILNFNNAEFIVMDVGENSPTRGSIGKLVPSGASTTRNEFKTLSQFFRAHYQCCRDGKYAVGEHGLDFEGERKTLAKFRSGDVQLANGAKIGW